MSKIIFTTTSGDINTAYILCNGSTAILVTHSGIAARSADRAVMLTRQGIVAHAA